jgi:hypothetical protein
VGKGAHAVNPMQTPDVRERAVPTRLSLADIHEGIEFD